MMAIMVIIGIVGKMEVNQSLRQMVSADKVKAVVMTLGK